MKYGQINHDIGKYSKWTTPKTRGYKMACCDCGLVHDFEFRAIKKGSLKVDLRTIQIQFRVQRNDRATSAMRRANQVKS
jgi:hypothetical protein